jgi:hypothetical protein
MIVVSNASPLVALAQAARLSILKAFNAPTRRTCAGLPGTAGSSNRQPKSSLIFAITASSCPSPQ